MSGYVIVLGDIMLESHGRKRENIVIVRSNSLLGVGRVSISCGG